MAIAPSKLGQFVLRYRTSDEVLLARLREAGLVRADATDSDVTSTLQAARDEDAASGHSPFNSPHERVRVFLAPYLTEKGQLWAVPLDSLRLRDGEWYHTWLGKARTAFRRVRRLLGLGGAI